MMLNPRTRLSSTPRLFVDGYRVGVRSHTDFMNATLYVRGDTALNGVCHAHRLKSTLPGIFQSDENVKKDFMKIRNPFYALNRISGFGFCYKDGDIPSMGFKAQEVEKIFPFLIEETDGIKYMQYIPLIAVNWEATKELNKQVNLLKEQLVSLKKKVKILKNTNKTTKPIRQALFNMQKKPKRLLNLKNIRVK